MYRKATFKTALTCALTALSLVRPALALNNRSWVSVAGSDGNDCSIAHPCRTFQHAHDATAAAGEVDVLEPGDYGPVTITKSITIDGGGMGYISSAGDAIDVNAAAGSTVIVRRLSLESLGSNTGNGIAWTSGEVLHVENVSIDAFTNGIAAGPFAAATTRSTVIARLFVEDTIIRECSDFGINLQPFVSFTAAVNHVTIENNTSSSSVTGGILVQGTTASVKNSLISRVPNGIVTDVQGQLELDNSTISYTTLGINAEGAGSLVRMGGNTIHFNTTGMAASSGAQIISYGNNQIAGNGAGETPTGTITLK